MNAYKPREYQVACLDALASARDQGDNKALIVMASGLGKTMTSAFDIIEYLKSNEDGRVLVLSHSSAIQDQTKEKFKEVFGDEYSYGMYNYNNKATRRTDFLFANLQSINLHCDEFNPEEFCYIVVDEAHHSPATTYRQAIQHFKPQFLLGMTATPDRTDNAGLKSIFGKTVFEYRLESAIKDGQLSEVEYHIKTDDIHNLEYYLDSGNKISLSQLNREIFIPKRDEEIARIIREETANLDNPTMVIFCQTIAHAEEFAKLMGDAVVIHSKLDADTIAKRLTGFRSGNIKTVCAVDMLNEGIDVPRTDVIVFLRVTQSRIVFTQQLGRGLRRVEGKNKVLVLDFVATADRLEMLFQLERDFKSSVGKYSRKPKNNEREHLSLDVDSPVFRDRKVDIIKLIEKARNSYRYTDEEMLDKMYALGIKLGHAPSRKEILSEPNMPHPDSYCNKFGSLANSYTKAGLDFKPNYRTYTDEELLQDFRKECEDLGHFPAQDEFHYHPSSTYKQRFKTLQNTANLAGCIDYWNKYNQRSRVFPEEEALDLLAEMYNHLGRVPKKAEIDSEANSMPSAQYYYLHFGGVLKALAKRNILPVKEERVSGPEAFWTKETIPQALKDLAKRIDRPIKKDDIIGADAPSSCSIGRVFGTLTAALLYSGLPVSFVKPTKNKKALATFQELGLPTDFYEFCKYVVENHDNPNSVASLVDLQSAKNRIKAIENKGKPKKKASIRPPREEMLSAIKAKAKELGRTPTRREMDADPNMPSSYFIKTEFNGYDNAMVEAGLTPNKAFSSKTSE